MEIRYLNTSTSISTCYCYTIMYLSLDYCHVYINIKAGVCVGLQLMISRLYYHLHLSDCQQDDPETICMILTRLDGRSLSVLYPWITNPKFLANNCSDVVVKGLKLPLLHYTIILIDISFQCRSMVRFFITWGKKKAYLNITDLLYSFLRWVYKCTST